MPVRSCTYIIYSGELPSPSHLGYTISRVIANSLAACEPPKRTRSVLLLAAGAYDTNEQALTTNFSGAIANLYPTQASSTGQLNTVMTFYEIAEPPIPSGFPNPQIPLLKKAIAMWLKDLTPLKGTDHCRCRRRGGQIPDRNSGEGVFMFLACTPRFRNVRWGVYSSSRLKRTGKFRDSSHSFRHMPHQIVEIDELVRLIIDKLVETSPRTAASFALTCRSLEEPTLSSLWKRQSSLVVLVKVLPQHTWIEETNYVRSLVSGRSFRLDHILYRFPQAIEDDPQPEDWDRLQRYASWMRELTIGWEGVTDEALARLSSNSPDGVLCPNLERLDWEVDASYAPLPFFRLFLSPHLKHVHLHTRFAYLGVLRDYMLPVKEVISYLPASLEVLSLTCGPWKGEPLKDAISSLVLRCGSPLRSFASRTPLSEGAFYHLMKLPNLRSWVAVGEPPQTFSLTTFPSLEELHLELAALPWLHLLAACEGGKRRNGLAPTATINTNIKETLKFLHCPRNTPVDSALLSSASSFRNLVTLYAGNGFCEMGIICTFGLTDNDVENLAVALPSLVNLQLGEACGSNSCRTTISSLLSISTHCLEITALEIHFNTQTIAIDIQRLLNEGSECDKPRCALRNLSVGCLPLRVREEDIGPIAMGFTDIFPCLENFSSYGGDRGRWKRMISTLRD